MNIFRHELQAYRKSTIIWSISLVLIIVLFMSFYSSFAKDAEEFINLLQNYPESIRQAFGINLDTFFSILGFYSYPLTFITLCGAIQAMNLGTSIVSKEVREKTADFLLTRPVTRNQVLTAKLLAALTSLVMTFIVYFAAASITAQQVKRDTFSFKIFFLLSLTLLFTQVIFLAIGILMSVLVPKIKSVLTVSLATVFAFYFLGMFSATSGDEAKRYLSPFKYFDNSYIMEHASFETPFLIVGVVIIILAIAASYLVYVKKDIHAV